jgi:hypothetical protein
MLAAADKALDDLLVEFAPVAVRYKQLKAKVTAARKVVEDLERDSHVAEIGDRVRALTGAGGEYVVVFAYSDAELFGAEGVATALKPGVRVDDIHLVVTECPAEQWRGVETLTDWGHVSIGKPLPKGWHPDVRDDDYLNDNFRNLDELNRAAQAGEGNFHWFSSTEDTEGLWGADLTWRVFFDSNFTGEFVEEMAGEGGGGGGEQAKVADRDLEDGKGRLEEPGPKEDPKAAVEDYGDEASALAPPRKLARVNC